MSRKNLFGLASRDYASLYNVWKNMISRCCDETNKSFVDYGQRGIFVCREWSLSFHAFVEWAIAVGWRRGLTLERKDVNGNYSPSNCCWITKAEQARNTRRNIFITINGQKKCLSEWCEFLELPYGRIVQRYTGSHIRDPKELFYRGDLRELRPSILQISLDGEVVGEFLRIKDASLSSGIRGDDINRVLSGKRKTTGGYRWEYRIKET